mgnify:CR=1 FL=1
MENTGVRINKFLSEAGVCSRREADRQVEAGQVTIDGVVAQTGSKVMPGQTVCFQGKTITKEEEMILLAFHKPIGIVCTAEKREKNNVIDYLHYPKRIYPVGRLDKDTEGLLLITNDGELAHRLLSPKKHVDKLYYARVEGIVGMEDIDAFAKGLDIGEGEYTKPAKLIVLKSDVISEIELIIQEGKFHQVKRMFEAVGKKVIYLKRLEMGTLKLDEGLALGEYRPLTQKELEDLC